MTKETRKSTERQTQRWSSGHRRIRRRTAKVATRDSRKPAAVPIRSSSLLQHLDLPLKLPSPSRSIRALLPKAEVEERNWNSSTATLQDKEESARSRSSKSRPSKSSSKISNYPLARDSRDEGYRAVRVSGPDRVIIVPTSTADGGPQSQIRTYPCSAFVRAKTTGTMPIVPPPAAANRRPSHDRRPSQTDRRARLTTGTHPSRDPTRLNAADRNETPKREQTSAWTSSAGKQIAQPSQHGTSSLSMNSRPVPPMPPMPDLPKATLLSQNMARARAGNRDRSTRIKDRPVACVPDLVRCRISTTDNQTLR